MRSKVLGSGLSMPSIEWKHFLRLSFTTGSIALRGVFATAQENGMPYPGQPVFGPGGADYTHDSVTFYDNAQSADGYWLFLPAQPQPESAEVVVFMHGYGAYNPMAYGKWIKHLVAKGNIVIYPRYQRNIVWPRADAFPENAARGIRNAIDWLKLEGPIRPNTDKVVYIGHSYGGVINANLAVNWKKFRIPEPVGLMLCEPGSGPLKGARLQDYGAIPERTALLIVVGEDDYVVGSEFGQLVFETAVNTPLRNLLVQQRDTNGHRWVLATHSEPYSYDGDFDTGVRNYTSQRVFSTSRLNEVDFYCYWKLGDALIDLVRNGKYAHVAFGNTPEQRFMGMWPDGRPVKPLKVYTPDMIAIPVIHRMGK